MSAQSLLLKRGMLLVLLICLVAMTAAVRSTTTTQYQVTMERLLSSPILSSANSPFDYNYNAAYLALNGGTLDCLAVRVQNMVGAIVPSKIAIFCETSDKWSFSRDPYVVIDPSQSPAQADGCEDPRIKLLPDQRTLLMFYTAVNAIASGGARAKLSLASCDLSVTPTCSSWVLHGPLFPELFWSKSGALLVRDAGAPHYLLWGDTSIFVATTTDLYNYTNLNLTLISPRPDAFDSVLVESGPPPLQLSDGNFLFLYNSAKQSNKTSPKSGWTLEYHIGYTILNATVGVPQVVQRSDTPLLSPTLGWETCNDVSMVPGLTPNVVFVNGAKALQTPNTFLVYYQGCDAKTGLALVTVAISESSS